MAVLYKTRTNRPHVFCRVSGNMFKDTVSTAKQLDQCKCVCWLLDNIHLRYVGFSKLVSLIPQDIYAPQNNASKTPSVGRNTKKSNKEKKKRGNEKKTLLKPSATTTEQTTKNSALAASQEKSQENETPLDSKLEAVLAKTRGEKLKNDPKVLKRKLKEKERKKRKSAREWMQRKKAQEEKQKLKQLKREQNIQKRKMKRKSKSR